MLVSRRAQHVLRLQVAVIHPRLVARRERVDELQERALHGDVVVGVRPALHDRSEEIAARAEVEHEERVELLLDDRVQRDDPGHVRHRAVVRDLALLLPREVRAVGVPEETLDGVVRGAVRGGREVLGEVDDAVRACAELLEHAQVEGAAGDGEPREVGEDGTHLHHGGITVWWESTQVVVFVCRV